MSRALVRCAHGPLGPRPRPCGSDSHAYRAILHGHEPQRGVQHRSPDNRQRRLRPIAATRPIDVARRASGCVYTARGVAEARGATGRTDADSAVGSHQRGTRLPNRTRNGVGSMSRAEHHRWQRARATACPTPTQLAVWHHGRQLPADHPLKAAEPIPSTRELGFRCIDAVERVRPFERIGPKFVDGAMPNRGASQPAQPGPSNARDPQCTPATCSATETGRPEGRIMAR